MRAVTLVSAAALTLIAGAAFAQEPNATQAQQQSFPAQPARPGTTTAPDHTVPPPPYAQPNAPLADLAKPAAVGPAQANTADSVPGEGPPGATPQTMPSTRSAENAKLDKLPITALQFPLNEEQKALIAKSVAEAPVENNANLANVHVAEFLPINTPSHDFSLEVMEKIPAAKPYRFIKLDTRMLIVDATNATVVGEIVF